MIAASESTIRDLCVFFSCHNYMFSIPSRRVERLVLSDDVKVCRSRSGSVSIPVVRSGQTKFAAWNLGRMVELPTCKGSWILLRISHAGAELPLALCVGACLLVAPIQETTPLPPGVFRGRHSALWATFETTSVSARLGKTSMGLCLDPLRLWSRKELDESAAALLAAEVE